MNNNKYSYSSDSKLIVHPVSSPIISNESGFTLTTISTKILPGLRQQQTFAQSKSQLSTHQTNNFVQIKKEHNGRKRKEEQQREKEEQAKVLKEKKEREKRKVELLRQLEVKLQQKRLQKQQESKTQEQTKQHLDQDQVNDEEQVQIQIPINEKQQDEIPEIINEITDENVPPSIISTPPPANSVHSPSKTKLPLKCLDKNGNIRITCHICNCPFSSLPIFLEHLKVRIVLQDKSQAQSQPQSSFVNDIKEDSFVPPEVPNNNNNNINGDSINDDNINDDNVDQQTQSEIKLPPPLVITRQPPPTTGTTRQYQPKLKKTGVFQCDTCNKCFPGKEFLDKHLEKGHQEPEKEQNQVEVPVNSSTIFDDDENEETCGFKNDHPYFSSTFLHSHSQRQRKRVRIRTKLNKNKRAKTIISELSRKRKEGEEEDKVAASAAATEEDENNSFQCSDCSLSFKLSSHLRQHKKTQHSSLEYKCQFEGCNKQFSRPSQLQLHNMSHTGEKPFLCLQCGKGFRRRCFLTIHEASHNQPSFLCSSCARVFKTKKSLENHEARHLLYGEKVKRAISLPGPFVCQHSGCKSSFISQDRLRVHTRLHDPAFRKYKCPECRKAFKSPSGLKKHEEVHSKINYYKCSYGECRGIFRMKQSLRRHIKVEHETPPLQNKRNQKSRSNNRKVIEKEEEEEEETSESEYEEEEEDE